MSKLLIQEQPLMVIRSLAMKIGLNEAIVLQQVHYWLTKNVHIIDGRSWVYNTYKEWQEQIPFWSESTIKRVFKTLEELGLIKTGNFNKYKMDQTKWYTIDYEKLKEFEIEEVFTALADGQAKPANTADLSIPGKAAKESMPLNATNPYVPIEATNTFMPGKTPNASVPIKTAATPEPAAEEEQEPAEKIPVAEVVQYLNEKTYSSFKTENSRTHKLITARWKEGFRLDDFKKVIDKKAADWLDHPKWSRYLRPQTLFGTKFESYLNQKPARKRFWEGNFRFDDET